MFFELQCPILAKVRPSLPSGGKRLPSNWRRPPIVSQTTPKGRQMVGARQAQMPRPSFSSLSLSLSLDNFNSLDSYFCFIYRCVSLKLACDNANYCAATDRCRLGSCRAQWPTREGVLNFLIFANIFLDSALSWLFYARSKVDPIRSSQFWP